MLRGSVLTARDKLPNLLRSFRSMYVMQDDAMRTIITGTMQPRPTIQANTTTGITESSPAITGEATSQIYAQA